MARRGGHPTPRDRRQQPGPSEALQEGGDELQTDQARERGPLHGGLHGSAPPSHHHQVSDEVAQTHQRALKHRFIFKCFLLSAHSFCKGRTLYSVVRDTKNKLDINKTRQIAQEIVKVLLFPIDAFVTIESLGSRLDTFSFNDTVVERMQSSK